MRPSTSKNIERIIASAKGSSIHTMTSPMRKYTTKILNNSLQGPIIAERRGEYDKKKMGTGRNAITLQKTFSRLCDNSGDENRKNGAILSGPH